MDFVVAKPLDTGVALAHDVVVIGFECDDSISLDGGLRRPQVASQMRQNVSLVRFDTAAKVPG